MSEMTPTQGRYLAYIRDYLAAFGLPPAESEIAQAMRVSPPSVNQMMKTLEKKGLIQREPGAARSIEILVDDDAIPPWKGKRITRKVRQWIRTSPAAHDRGPATHSKSDVYRFKIVLDDTKPVIWRRIETSDVTLGKLHELIQTAMGWTNSHMHQFEIAGTRYTDPRFIMGEFDDFGAIDYSAIRLSDLVAEHGPTLLLGYEYDFGDGWQHTVVLEKVAPPEPGAKYPRCVEGERACPPEDVGGVFGFAEYVAAITNPKHQEHRELLKWYGPFDPAEFDAAKATKRMKKGLPAW